ncbi:MAG: zeta toxin family protein [Nitrospiria bacterium]
MRGDKIIVEEHHAKAAKKIVEIILHQITSSARKYSLSVAGESGSGKSEISRAIADELENKGIMSVILQQDDYFAYPPKTNDKIRRRDIGWVGPQEVHLDILDQNLRDFLCGQSELEKPLVIYDEDLITKEIVFVENAKVAIAEGTYTSLLENLSTRTFIDRNYNDTRAYREKRRRNKSELDAFTGNVLEIEHVIISAHKAFANIIITKKYGIRVKVG